MQFIIITKNPNFLLKARRLFKLIKKASELTEMYYLSLTFFPPLMDFSFSSTILAF